MSVREGVDLVKVDASTSGDSVVRRSILPASRGGECRVIAERLEFARPQGESSFLTAPGEMIMATVLDHQFDTGLLGESERCLHVVRVLDFQIVRRHIALIAGPVGVGLWIYRIGVVEQTLVRRVGRAHIILAVHVGARDVCAEGRVGVVGLDRSACNGILGDMATVIPGEAW